LLAVAAELWPEEAEEHARKALTDADWRPRLQAVDVCAGLRTTGSIRILVGCNENPSGLT
jgi:hypothetical protein